MDATSLMCRWTVAGWSIRMTWARAAAEYEVDLDHVGEQRDRGGAAGREIGEIAAEADVYFHTDAVQAAGKIPVEVDEIGCDLLTISGHKLHGPQGVGALYVRKGTRLGAMMYGGRHERSRRAGTENVPGIVGWGRRRRWRGLA